jgi:hypothetical protein
MSICHQRPDAVIKLAKRLVGNTKVLAPIGYDKSHNILGDEDWRKFPSLFHFL